MRARAGADRALPAALQDAGHERVRLDAGPEQEHSCVLFEATGYVEIPSYNNQPHRDLLSREAPLGDR